MQSNDNRDSSSLFASVVAGAIAGSAATWTMGKVTEILCGNESKSIRDHEDSARGRSTAYAVAAQKVAGLAGKSLTKKESETAGARIHWALGVGAGAFYAALRARVPSVGIAGGLGFGAAFWAQMDEGAVYALRLTPGPTKFPWEINARGLAGHLVFGVVTDTTLSALQKVV